MKEELSQKIDKKAVYQFVRFAIVGIINTSVTLAVIFILQELLQISYTTSNFIGYIAGVVNSFFWSKLWVFKKNNGNFMLEILFFFIAFVICYAIQYICLLTMVEKLEFNKLVAQLLGMIVYTVANFILNRCITFKK